MIIPNGITLIIRDIGRSRQKVGNEIIGDGEQKRVHFKTTHELKEAISLQKSGEIKFITPIPDHILELMNIPKDQILPPSDDIPKSIIYRDEFLEYKEQIDEALKSKVGEEGLEEIKFQLANTRKETTKLKDSSNRELISKRNRKPMISFIDDDGRTDVLTKWLPLLKRKNFKLDIATIAGWVGTNNYMTWEQLADLRDNYNVDMVNHTFNHPSLGTLTEAEVREQFQKSTEILKEKGHTHDIMVYPYGSQNATVRQVAREYCRAGIYTAGGVATPPLDTFMIVRETLMNEGTPMKNVGEYTKFIDEAIAKNGWIIFMSHSQYSVFDVEKISQIIDYANSKGIEWVHAKEGLDNIGNLIDIGDYTARSLGSEYTILDANGVMHSKANNNYIAYAAAGKYTIDSVPSDFPAGKITITTTNDSTKSGFPGGVAGVLTINNTASATYPYQEYHTISTGKTFKRTWLGSAWSTFLEMARIVSFTKPVSGVVPAKGTLNVTVNFVTTPTDIVTCTPPVALEPGIMYSIMLTASNRAMLRFFNATDTDVTLEEKTWNFTSIKR